MNSSVEISVVIPVFDEADAIAGLIEEIYGVLNEVAGFEVIVVDDGSTDSTAGILDSCAARYARLRVLHHAGNFGQSAAICTGVDEAEGCWIVTMDGDGQNDPGDIPDLYRYVSGPDKKNSHIAVLGQRMRRQDTTLKRLASRVANAVRSRALGDGVADTGCGLKLFPKDLFLRLPRFDHMHRFLPALIKREGGTLILVEVLHRPRTGGRSKYGIGGRLWAGIVDLFGVLWLQRRAIVPVEDQEKNHD